MDLGAATEPAYRKDLCMLVIASSNIVQQTGDSLHPQNILVSTLFWGKALYSGKKRKFSFGNNYTTARAERSTSAE